MRAPLVEHASGDQNRKSAFAIRRCRGDRLHSVPHQPFGSPPCVSKRRLVALSRCPNADCILRAAEIGWNGTIVWNVLCPGARGSPKRTLCVRLRNAEAKTDPGYGPEVPPFRSPRDWASTIFPASVRKFPGMVWASGDSTIKSQITDSGRDCDRRDQ